MTVFLLILALAYFGGSYFAYNALRSMRESSVFRALILF